MQCLKHIVVVGMLLAGGVAAAEPVANAPVEVNIPAQGLGDALNALAAQTGLQLIFNVEEVMPREMQAPAVKGTLTPEAALRALLANTGLQYKFIDSRTVALSAEPEKGAAVVSAASPLKVAQADAESSDPAAAAAAENPNADDVKLEEILVTAQKRVERLQDVPVPVTAISADSLVNNGQVQLQEYYTKIPGLQMTSNILGTPMLIVRGITTGVSNPTVGVVVDEVPYGSSAAQGDGGVVPDIDPSNLARVEVLRGPQGTLYGVSSMGGLLKFVTVDPSTERVSGLLQGNINSVRNGDELGHNVRGSVNLPVSDTWALRASGFTRRDPGYIDNVRTGEEGINRADASGGRVSALWRPSDNFSLKLGALIQEIDADGINQVHDLPGLGEFEQSTLRGTGWHKRRFDVYSANLTARVADIDVTAVSGYGIYQFDDRYDASFFTAPTASTVGEGVLASRFTQEVRLSGSAGPTVDWLFGAFYDDERSRFDQDFLQADPDTGETVATFFDGRSFWTYEEHAAFADVTVHLTERFNLQIGGRQSWNEQANFNLGAPTSQQKGLEDDAFTYLLTPQFKVSPDLMVYVRLASGYRAGGGALSDPNALCIVFTFPCTFAPDKTKNYEIGIKGDALDHRLSFDASVFYIDWSDIQIYVLDDSGQAAFFTNAGSAKSQGVELAMEARPLRGLTLAAWASWNNAELTEDLPPLSTVVGSSGDRLPYSSRFSGNFSLDQEFALTDHVTGFVGGSLSYTGDRKGVFNGVAARQDLPAYAKTDVHAGVRFGSWTANLFVNNVTDRRGVVTGGLGASPPYGFQYIQPRTMGMSLTKIFGL